MVEDRDAEADRWVGFMKQKLKEHANKGSWSSEDPIYLTRRLLEEVAELLQSKSITEAYREAADVANFAFMLAGNMCKEQNDEKTATSSKI